MSLSIVPKEEFEDLAKFVAPGGELERLENRAREQMERETSGTTAEKKATDESIPKTEDDARKKEPPADGDKDELDTTLRHSSSNSKSA